MYNIYGSQRENSYMEHSTKLVEQFLHNFSTNTVNKYQFANIAEFGKFLSSDKDAGSLEVLAAVLKSFEQNSDTDLSHRQVNISITSLILTTWRNNKHFTKETYRFLGEEKTTFNSPTGSVIKGLQEGMWMNDNAVHSINEGGSSRFFMRNTNGTKLWLEKLVELTGESFFRRGYNLEPFLRAGVLKTEDFNIPEVLTGETVANLVTLDLKQYDLALTYQAVKNLSIRYLRTGGVTRANRFSDRHDFLNDEELDKMFHEKYGIHVYDVLLERVKELVPADISEQKGTHSGVISNLCNYFFSQHNHASYTSAAYDFAQTYKDNASVKASLQQTINFLRNSDQSRTVRWLSVVTGQPESDFEQLPKEWLLRMLEELL